ncbi:MAG: iron complex transport system substrate-binding protein [Planctomycetota bacterium]|jgi:iron complex transport system substrate-binding protein
MRIASLLPSATEMVCAVGARDELVGISHECDFPIGVDVLPALTRTRQSMPRTSGEIDKTVRAILTDAIAVYEVDVELMRTANPDVIVTQDLCDVCAVSIDDVRRVMQELANKDVEIVSLKPLRLEDIWEDVRRVGRALGREQQAVQAAQGMIDRVQAIGVRSQAIPGPRPKVLTIEWLDPIMVGGLWMPQLVELAGGEALVTKIGEHAPTLDLEALAALDPDVVLIKPCGFGLERTKKELPLLQSMLPWDSWSAVQDGRVYLTDGNAYFNRPGPRLVESLEILAACTHPKTFVDFTKKHAASLFVVGADLSVSQA